MRRGEASLGLNIHGAHCLVFDAFQLLVSHSSYLCVGLGLARAFLTQNENLELRVYFPVFWDSSMELTEKPHTRVAVRRRQAPVMNSKRTFTSCTQLTRGRKQIPHATLTPISTRGCRELKCNCLGPGMGRRHTSYQVSPVAVADANEY